MSPKSAEIVKYAANALLATKISFMNEIAELCDRSGADVEHVRVGIGTDRRIGMQCLYPGLGFGGSCFPKALRALVRTGEELGTSLSIASAAQKANERPVQRLLSYLERDLESLRDKVIAIWGLAFKPRTDDVREAPALRLAREIVKRGGSVKATDPEALDTAKDMLMASGGLDRITLMKDPYECCQGADALVLATEWSEYRAPSTALLPTVGASAAPEPAGMRHWLSACTGGCDLHRADRRS
jgi:UDPglucose 6-dehydrogenase